ncbi:transporter substrate-binding domain-containing protein [bacterium]|nr:transporter substrate-binding domain-containing protein [bacterium]
MGRESEMKFIVIFLLLCMVLIPCITCASDDTVLASGHPDWQPAMYQSGESIVGIAPEIVTAVFGTLDLKVECIYVGSWTNVQELGKRGDIDVIVAGYKTEEREKYFVFSDSFMSDNISVFSVQNILYDKPESLKGYRIAVSRGDSYGQGIDNFLASDQAIVTVYDDPREAMSSVAQGENNLFLYSTVAGKKILKEHAVFKNVKEEVIGNLPFYMMISKKSKYAELLPEINQALKFYEV